MNGISLGHFEILEPIATGGMAEVWRGIHPRSQKPVALKLVRGELARQASFHEAFRNEVRAMASLSHPHIVRIFDTGDVPLEASAQTGGVLEAQSPYLVMALMQGGTLGQITRPLPWSSLRRVLHVLLDALAHAHARGVVHLDLKPDNILLDVAPSPQRPLWQCIKLTDFGIARAFEPPLLVSPDDRLAWLEQQWNNHVRSTIVGTPTYMAPEQFMGQWRDMGPSTDLYALGCLAFELASGKPPFPYTTSMELARAHWHEPVPELKGPCADVPGLNEWLQRLLEKERHLRFECAADATFALLQLPERGPQEADRNTDEDEDDTDTVSLSPGWSPHSPPPSASALEEQATQPLSSVSTASPQETTASSPSAPEERSTRVTQRLPLLGTLRIEGPLTQILGLKAMQSTRMEDLDATQRIALPRWETPAPPTTWHQPHVPEEDSSPLMGPGLFGLRALPFFGREHERDQLWQALLDVYQHACTRLVILRGPAGHGKSRLVEWLAARALEVGAANVLRAYYSATPGPMDGFGPMLSRHFRCQGLSPDAVQERLTLLLREQGVEDPYEWEGLTELLSSELQSPLEPPARPTETVGTPSPPPRLTQGARFALLKRHLERLGRRRPVLLHIDDAQWGLEALQFLQHLLAQGPLLHPFLILLTVEEEQIPAHSEILSLVERLAQEPGVMELPLRPLEPLTHQLMLQRLLGLSPALAYDITERTECNSFFSIQLVGEWMQQGLLEFQTDGLSLRLTRPTQLPATLHELWMARILRALPGETSRETPLHALELAAALGARFQQREWKLACQLAKIPVNDAWLELWTQRRLLQSSEGSIPSSVRGARTWSFVHEALRQSLEQSAREGGRWFLHHRACALMLERVQKPSASVLVRRVYHWLSAEDEEEALPPLLHAARLLEQQGDYQQAERLVSQLEVALRKLAVPPDDDRWGQCWLIRCGLLRAVGQVEQALAVARKTEKAARAHGWQTLLGPVLRLRAAIAQNQGYIPEAITLAEEALVCFELTHDTQGVAKTLRSLATCYMEEQRQHSVIPLLERARGLAQMLRDTSEEAQILLAMARHARLYHQLNLAEQHHGEALRLFEQQQERRGIADTLRERALVQAQQGHLEQARQGMEDALSCYEQLGCVIERAYLLNDIATVYLQQGRSMEAEQTLHHSIALYQRFGAPIMQLIPLYNLGTLYLTTTRYADAHPLFEYLITLCQKNERPQLLPACHACLLVVFAWKAQWEDWENSFKQAERLRSLQPIDPGDVDVLLMAADMLHQKEEPARERQVLMLMLPLVEALQQDARRVALLLRLRGLPHTPS
ncbi:MAG: protein kinase domain-containing protein [Myxococcota bacterium]